MNLSVILISILCYLQIESYSTHKADILSIAVSDDEKSLFCSGVDPVIMNFIKVNKNMGKQSDAQWVKNVQRNIHEHDVRCVYTLLLGFQHFLVKLVRPHLETYFNTSALAKYLINGD